MNTKNAFDYLTGKLKYDIAQGTAISLRGAEDGIVLLENKNRALPLKDGETVAEYFKAHPAPSEVDDPFMNSDYSYNYVEPYVVTIDGKRLTITNKEFDLLVLMVNKKNIALTREEILGEIWGLDYFGDGRTVDTHIKMLRGNLKEYRKFIVTLRGLGYKFEE